MTPTDTLIARLSARHRVVDVPFWPPPPEEPDGKERIEVDGVLMLRRDAELVADRRATVQQIRQRNQLLDFINGRIRFDRPGDFREGVAYEPDVLSPDRRADAVNAQRQHFLWLLVILTQGDPYRYVEVEIREYQLKWLKYDTLPKSTKIVIDDELIDPRDGGGPDGHYVPPKPTRYHRVVCECWDALIWLFENPEMRRRIARCTVCSRWFVRINCRRPNDEREYCDDKCKNAYQQPIQRRQRARLREWAGFTP